ncbi:MAG: AAA family ATPase [Phycisphaerae bacterium]
MADTAKYHGIGLADNWRLAREPFAVELTTASGHAFRRGPESHPDWERLVQPLQPVVLIRPPSSGFEFSGPGFSDSAEPPILDEQGTLLPALLDYVLRRHRTRFDDIVEAARARIPGCNDIDIGTPLKETRSIEFKIENGLLLPCDGISVGVRHLIFYLALAYHPNPPNLILLEEPENGLHAHRLGEVMSILRGITKGEHCGHAAQIIMSTHSPHLLDHVNLDEDQVLVFRREDDGSRTAQPVDKDRLKHFLHEFMLGEIWFNEEEAGLVSPKQ